MTIALPSSKDLNLEKQKRGARLGIKQPPPVKRERPPREGESRLEWILDILSKQTEEGRVNNAMVGVGKLFLDVEKWRASLPENATQNYEAPKALKKLQAQLDALDSYAPEYLKESENGS